MSVTIVIYSRLLFGYYSVTTRLLSVTIRKRENYTFRAWLVGFGQGRVVMGIWYKGPMGPMGPMGAFESTAFSGMQHLTSVLLMEEILHHLS